MTTILQTIIFDCIFVTENVNDNVTEIGFEGPPIDIYLGLGQAFPEQARHHHVIQSAMKSIASLCHNELDNTAADHKMWWSPVFPSKQCQLISIGI